jgi:hypothetical protein
MKAVFDAPAFFNALDAIRESRSLNWAQVSRECDVPSSTMTGLANGSLPSVGSLAKMKLWAGISIDRFFTIAKSEEKS